MLDRGLIPVNAAGAFRVETHAQWRAAAMQE
jgi:hypothetical protein